MEPDSFVTVGLQDVVDILLVAFLLYKLFKMARGTTAMTIFLGITVVYVLWFVVRLLKMELTSTIIGQVMGMGILALLIVFQQEIRRFLLYVGSQYMAHRKFSLRRFLAQGNEEASHAVAEQLVEGCMQLGRTKTGALIVIAQKNDLQEYIDTGVLVDAAVRARSLESIFFKNAPLHDGAVVLRNERIEAAQCILPVSNNPSIPPRLGLRHRAAVGLTEGTDALVIVVSEETGKVSLVEGGSIREGVSREELLDELGARLSSPGGTTYGHAWRMPFRVG